MQTDLMETHVHFSFQQVLDGNGIAITITGMLIVFFALTLITLYLIYLPKFLQLLDKWIPHKEESPMVADAPQTQPSFSPELAAVIGYALHLELKKQPHPR